MKTILDPRTNALEKEINDNETFPQVVFRQSLFCIEFAVCPETVVLKRSQTRSSFYFLFQKGKCTQTQDQKTMWMFSGFHLTSIIHLTASLWRHDTSWLWKENREFGSNISCTEVQQNENGCFLLSELDLRSFLTSVEWWGLKPDRRFSKIWFLL